MRIPGFTAETALYRTIVTFQRAERVWHERDMLKPAGIIGGLLAAGACGTCFAGDDFDFSGTPSLGRFIACGACAAAVFEPL